MVVGGGPGGCHMRVEISTETETDHGLVGGCGLGGWWWWLQWLSQKSGDWRDRQRQIVDW